MSSANIVGYESVSVKEGKYTAFAIQFESVDQKDIAIKDLFTIDSSFFPATSASGAGDQIWMWDATSGDWVKWYYRGGRGVAADKVGWTKADEDAITTSTIKAGETAFFYRGGSDASLTLSGGVKAFSSSCSTVCTEGKYNFLAYPWPIALKVSDFTKYYSDGDPFPATAVTGAGDQIWLWNSTTGDWIKYYYRGGRGVAADKVGWNKGDEDGVTNESIPVATGFFFYRGGGDVTITFTNDTTK